MAAAGGSLALACDEEPIFNQFRNSANLQSLSMLVAIARSLQPIQNIQSETGILPIPAWPMSVTRVTIAEDVFLTCMSHALTTEREEIMGLILGDIVVWRKCFFFSFGRCWALAHPLQCCQGILVPRALGPESG